MFVRGAILAAALVAVGCGDNKTGVGADAGGVVDANTTDAAPVCNGDFRSSSAIYYGTAQPTHVPLSAGQILAIGMAGECSGTLIAPDWVMTAKHCSVAAGDKWCVGSDPGNPDQCFDFEVVIHHDSSDTTLGYLGIDIREHVPGIVPIPIMDVAMDATWIGKTAEAAGYGEQEDGRYGEREFTAEPISDLGDFLTIDGQGERGACFGDSGGPVMIIAADNTVRVAGALSGGDTNCLGEDNYARTDLIADWIESFTGPTIVGDGPFDCGQVTSQGRCMAAGGMATWCGNDQTLNTDACAEGSTCGWDSAASGYRCITGADPCGGVDTFGVCDGTVARWCEDGVAKSRDCGACDETCTLDGTRGGAGCAPDPCMGLDYQGRCNGDVAEWCDGGQFQSVDCADRGETCGFINDDIGYFCS